MRPSSFTVTLTHLHSATKLHRHHKPAVSKWTVTNGVTTEAVRAHQRRAHLVGNDTRRSGIAAHTHTPRVGRARRWQPVLRILPDEARLVNILARRTTLVLLRGQQTHWLSQ